MSKLVIISMVSIALASKELSKERNEKVDEIKADRKPSPNITEAIEKPVELPASIG